jgi:heme-degrading monooxygenase HmoA
MIRHIVVINFRKGEYPNYLELLDKTKSHIAKIPGILSYKILRNESHYTPKNRESYRVEIIFRDQEALETFMSHSEHEKANAHFEKYLADFMVLTFTEK